MSRNCTLEAYDWLESREPGLFRAHIATAFERGGIVHADRDCFFVGVPDETDPDTFFVLFQLSELPALIRLAAMYRGQYKRLRYNKDFKAAGITVTISLDALVKKSTLAARLTRHA